MTASLHLRARSIWTGDPARPRATSLTIESGRIVALDAAPPAGARCLDVRDGTAVPGLIDAHLHLVLGGLALGRLDLGAVRSRAEFERAIAAAHAALPPDRWLVAEGWSNERWDERTLPDRSWLAAAGSRPVVCHRSDLHAVLVNDAVLARLPLDRDPPGGRIARDERGAPTGLFVEAAAWTLVNPVIPDPSPAEKQAALLAAQAHLHRLGITAVGTMEYGRTVEQVLVPRRDDLTLACRLVLLDREWPIDLAYALEFDADDRLAVIGMKAFIDGTLGSRTAAMLADYADDPGNRGTFVELAREGTLPAWARAVAGAGLMPVMHAIGDAAVRCALDVADAVAPAPVRIEHVQHVHAADVPRFAGRFASMQPLHRADDGRYAERRLGRDRLAGAFAFRTLAAAGARLAFGSDWTAAAADPLAGIRAAVTGLTTDGGRFRPEENLDLDSALRAYTGGAAAALRLADRGRLAVGCRGDVTVLDNDPFAADWAESPPRVRCTVASGRVVYDAAG